jgi:serine protease Do
MRADTWAAAAAAAAVWLTACAGVVHAQVVKSVPTPQAIAVGAGAQKILARRFFVTPNNEVVGTWARGIFCSGAEDVVFNQRLGSGILRDMGLVVRRELDAAGYPRVQESAFEAAIPDKDVEYELAATLVDIRLKVCGTTEAEGQIWARLDWELFSPRERRVVYRAPHEGSVTVEGSKKLPWAELHRQVLASATRNLLADPRFVEQATRRATASSVPSAPDMAIATKPAAGARVQDRMPALQSAVATVFAGNASGSGFYVAAEGYLLTNQHVVGDAKFVKVRLATGRELLGEVVRSVASRDIALVKTDTVTLAPFELSDSEPKVGDEVYALGSPFGETFASSVTRGVVSGFRDVEQQRWLQSDVQILPGSSGGPLVALDGAVVGVASRGVAGLNLFIPIRDAMVSLRLDFRRP